MVVSLVFIVKQLLVLVADEVEDEVEDGTHNVAGYPKVGAMDHTNVESHDESAYGSDHKVLHQVLHIVPFLFLLTQEIIGNE